jgi:hypothetical protein
VPFHRKRWDAQPTDRCEVLLASDGRRDFSQGAVAQAAALAGSGNVAVVTIAKIYGTQFGMPHPGLLPNKQELAERHGWVEAAIRQLRKQGIEADGQVAATRRPTKQLAKVAQARGVSFIVIDETKANGLRRLIEGDVGSELRRKLRKSGIAVEVIPVTPD